MSTKLHELIEGATPGPWINDADKRQVLAPQNRQYIPTTLIICTTSYTHEHTEPVANAQLIARCHPETMKAVLEALENILAENRNDIGGPDNEFIHQYASSTLALLNGESP